MKTLLVMPRFIQSVNEGYTFPLGIAYVSASLKQITSGVYTLNLNLNMDPIEDQIRTAILDNDIDALGTGGLSPNYNQIKKIIGIAKAVKPDIITMVGGGLMTATPNVIMQGIPDLDIGMIGEGELIIQEIYRALANGQDKRELEHIDGIVYRDKENRIIQTNERPDIEDLDALPFPDYDGFQFTADNEVSICTSRSCPYSCTFCFHTCGKRYRSRSLDNIFKEIDWLVEKYNIHFLGILDELFSINLEKMNEFCDRIKDYNIGWSCQMRVDRMTVDILKKMKECGCVSLSFGIENADNDILKSMEKHITIEQIDAALSMAREARINPFGNLLLGDKNDTRESFHRCMRWYEAHPELQIGFSKILVLPGSKLYKYAVENGYIKNEVEYITNEKFTINVTKMTDEEYNACVHEIDEAVVKRFYPAKDTKVLKIDREKKNVVTQSICPLCGEKLVVATVDFTGGQNYTCNSCGQNYNINLYFLLKEDIEKQFNRLLNDEDKKIVIWGIGAEGLRIANMLGQIAHPNLYLVDKDIAKQGESIQGKVIGPLESIADQEIDYVLIGTNAPVTNQGIKDYIKENCPRIKAVYNLNKFIFKLAAKYHRANVSELGDSSDG